MNSKLPTSLLLSLLVLQLGEVEHDLRVGLEVSWDFLGTSNLLVVSVVVNDT